MKISPKNRTEVRIIISKEKDGYTGTVHGIDGVVVGQGASEEEALRETVSGLKFHLETFERQKMPLIGIKGKPVFIGTKIAVADVLKELAKGRTITQALKKFPDLKEDHVREALRFASREIHMRWLLRR